MRMQLRVLAVMGSIALFALPAFGATAEPGGVPRLKLGETLEVVRKAYPEMQPATGNAGAQAFDSPHLQRFVMGPVAVAGLKNPTSVELRFWQGKLWAVIVYFGKNDDADVLAALTKRLGPPTASTKMSASWQGPESLTMSATSQRWYAVTDNALSTSAQAWFLENLKQAQASGVAPQVAATLAAPAAGSAAATPAVAATAATAATPAAAK